jgi:hypothetical protein
VIHRIDTENIHHLTSVDSVSDRLPQYGSGPIKA